MAWTWDYEKLLVGHHRWESETLYKLTRRSERLQDLILIFSKHVDWNTNVVFVSSACVGLNLCPGVWNCFVIWWLPATKSSFPPIPKTEECEEFGNLKCSLMWIEGFGNTRKEWNIRHDASICKLFLKHEPCPGIPHRYTNEKCVLILLASRYTLPCSCFSVHSGFQSNFLPKARKIYAWKVWFWRSEV